jgi:hypothetical protein
MGGARKSPGVAVAVGEAIRAYDEKQRSLRESAQHTPGPVEILARLALQDDRYHRDMDFRDAIDNVIGNPVWDAAPDLLDVATRCLAMVEEGAGPPNWDWIREVIAKAKGRSDG